MLLRFDNLQISGFPLLTLLLGRQYCSTTVDIPGTLSCRVLIRNENAEMTNYWIRVEEANIPRGK